MRSITSFLCAAIVLTSSVAFADAGVDAAAPLDDAGIQDAGNQPQDSGLPKEAGTVSDAGTVPADLSACDNDENKIQGGGIACSSSASVAGIGASGLGVLLFVPLLLRRRRRS